MSTNDTTIMLSNVRLSFPGLVDPRASVEGGIKKYSADFIMTPEQFGPFWNVVNVVAQAKWKEQAQPVLAMIQGDRKLRCYGAGQEKIDPKTFKPYIGYEGNLYVSANNANQPAIIGPNGAPIDASNTMAAREAARKFYGGCYVNVALKPWPQENKHGRGMRCELIAIQFARDGEAFGAPPPDLTGMFGAVAAQTGAFGAAPEGAVPAFGAAPAPAFNPLAASPFFG